MSKNKRKTAKQEKAEMRRQMFASVQGKVQGLKKETSYLMHNNKLLEEENNRLRMANQELREKISKLERTISVIQESQGITPEEMSQKVQYVEMLNMYSSVLNHII